MGPSSAGRAASTGATACGVASSRRYDDWCRLRALIRYEADRGLVAPVIRLLFAIVALRLMIDVAVTDEEMDLGKKAVLLRSAESMAAAFFIGGTNDIQ